MENDSNNENQVQNVTEPVQEVQPNIEVPQEPITEVQTVTPQEPQVQIQMTNQEEPNKKKLDKKTIMKIVIASVLVLSAIICFLLFHDWGIKIDNNNPKSVLEGYFKCLKDKDYTNAYSLAYLPDNSIVELDDFLKYISNSKDMSDKKIVNIERISKSQTSTTYEVEFNDSSKKYKYELNMLSNGEWKIKLDDLYIEGWMVEVPGDSKLFIDNKPISKDLSKKEKDHDIYTLTIAPNTKKIKIETTFETSTTKIDVASSNSGEKILPEITKQNELDKALEEFKEIFNNLYNDYVKNTSKEEVLKKYYDSNFKLEDMDNFYTKNFDTLTKKGNKNNIFTNIEIESIVANPNKQSIIEGNDILRIEFGYKINFLVDYIYSGSNDLEKSMTRYSSIKLRKTSDGYKISEITDEKLFNFLSYTYVEF